MLRRFLAADSFRAPQFVAATLLLIYLLQCVWLIHVQALQGSIPASNNGTEALLLERPSLCVPKPQQVWPPRAAPAILG
jgi:hypothetical protein